MLTRLNFVFVSHVLNLSAHKLIRLNKPSEKDNQLEFVVGYLENLTLNYVGNLKAVDHCQKVLMIG
jgi:hypothetical protein